MKFYFVFQFQTQLANTAQDNPNKLTKFDVINYILNYIPTDTILFHSEVDLFTPIFDKAAIIVEDVGLTVTKNFYFNRKLKSYTNCSALNGIR